MNNTIRLLHLEDEPSDALLVSHSLKQTGISFEFLVVDTKEKFLSALQDFEPDLILADHSLPSFNSFEALELLGKHEKKIPVIMVTASMTDEFAVKAIKRGAKDYVLKDRLKRLPSAINNVLEIQRLEKEKESFLIQLQRNERKFRRLIENGADAVAVLTPEGSPTYVTSSVKRILGYSENEALKLNIHEIIHEDHRECVLEKFQDCLAKPLIPFEGYPVRVRHKDGSWRWLEVTLTNFTEDTAVEGIVADFRDVTERKIAEKTLKESEEKYRAFFENSLDGILLTAPDGRIFGANAAACKMFQRTEKDLCEVGRPGVVDLNDSRLALSLKERESKGKVMVELNMVRKDGSIFPVSLSSAIFEDANGEKLTSMIIRDISESKRAEEELKASEKKYRRLFQNNPLPNFIYDKDTFELLDGNKAALDHYGFTREEFLKLSILDFLPEEDTPDFKKFISKLPDKGGEVSHNNSINLKKNGERINVETFGYGLQYKERNCRLVICLDISEKEATLSKLKEKTEKLQTAQSIAKLGSWAQNMDNDDLSWSEEVYAIWEKDSSVFEPNLKSFEGTIHPEDLSKFKEESAVAFKGEKELDLEYRIITSEDSIKWVHERGKLNKNCAGKLVFEGTVQDITERKNSLEKLVKSEARLRGLIQSQTNYVIRIDLEGRYTYGNKKFRDDFGWIYRNEEMVGEDSMVSIKEYDYPRVQEAAEKCMANPGQVVQVEMDKPAKGGGVKTTLWDFTYLKGTATEPEEIQCVGIDITDRVKAEEKNRFQAELLDKIGQAVVATDVEGRITYWNQGASKIYGWESKEVLNKNIMKVTPFDNHEQASEIMKIVREGKIWKGEFKVRRKNGTTFPAYVTDSPVYDSEGNLKGIVGISSDMTERKKADDELRELNENLKKYTEELVEANKGLEQFSFIVSHNLRSPVANILGLADLIDNEEYPQEVKNNFLKALFDNVKRLDTVITDLNKILQIKVEMDAKKEPVILNDFIDSIKNSIQNVIEKEKVQITTHFNVPAIHTVQSYLHSIFYNLLANSIKYRRPGFPPHIEIRSESKEGSVVITFEDNGLGIDLVKKREQVFGLYRRFHSHIEGKGMGLFLVKTQVELLGGKISIESEVNSGTKFTISFKEEALNNISQDEKETALYGG